MSLIYFYHFTILISLFHLNFQKLLFVNIHFRHGARSSLILIDKHNRDLLGNIWEKRGILTSKGKRQVFLNGIKHREKYSHFLSNKYIEDEIKAYSTDSYRSISSLECYLNGLYQNNDNITDNILKKEDTVYPPGNMSINMINQVEELDLNVIPKDNHIIPINIFQKSDHSFVLHEPKKISDCQKIAEIREENVIINHINEKAKIFEEKYSDKLDKFFLLNNISLNNIQFNYTFYLIGLFCDTLYADFIDKKNISILIKDLDFDELYNDCLNFLSMIQSDYVSGNKDVVYMSQSPPIKKLISWMDQRIELDKKGKTDDIISGFPRFTIWSGHDSSISTFEKFMKQVFSTKWIFPEFSSTILFELHKNDETQLYEIKYFVNDELLLTANYDDFKNKVMNVIWTDEEIEKFCQFSIIHIDKMKLEAEKYHIIIIVLIILLIVSNCFNLYNWFKRIKKIKEN